MNGQIMRLTYVALALVGVARRHDDVLADVGRGRSRREAGQRDPARRGVLDRPRPHLLVRAAAAARAEPRACRRRQDALLPPLPVRLARRTRRRLLDRRTVAHGARALAQRLPDRLQRKPLDGPRQGARRAPRQADPGERRRDDARPRRPAGRAGAARHELRRRRRARSAYREGPRHGRVPELRPEPRRGALRAHLADHGELHARGAAPQPGERRPVHPRLDLQGDHGVRGARIEEVRAGLDLLRPGVLHRVRETGFQLRRPERSRGLRHDQPRDGPRPLGELGVLQHRPQARREADPRHGEAVRLLRAATARDAGRRAAPERPLSRREAVLPDASTRTSTPGGWPSDRSGCS